MWRRTRTSAMLCVSSCRFWSLRPSRRSPVLGRDPDLVVVIVCRWRVFGMCSRTAVSFCQTRSIVYLATGVSSSPDHYCICGLQKQKLHHVARETRFETRAQCSSSIQSRAPCMKLRKSALLRKHVPLLLLPMLPCDHVLSVPKTFSK